MKKLLFLLILPLINLNAQNFSGSWGYEIDGKDIVLGVVLMVDRPITADFGSVTFEDCNVIAGQLKE